MATGKLIKKFDNDSDYVVCVFAFAPNKFVVTTYDTVEGTHNREKTFTDERSAIAFGKQLNTQYSFSLNEETNQTVNEAVNGGWEIDSSEAEEAYNMAAKEWGNEELNAAIVRCLSEDTLAQCLAYIFRMYDFRKWSDRNEDNGYEEENDILSETIKRTIRRVLKEGIYDYPDGIDHLIFLSENDRECYDFYMAIKKALEKKFAKGVELSVDILANSSAMKKYQQLVFRKFKAEQQEQGMMDPRTGPYQFRRYVAEKMIDNINNGF